MVEKEGDAFTFIAVNQLNHPFTTKQNNSSKPLSSNQKR